MAKNRLNGTNGKHDVEVATAAPEEELSVAERGRRHLEGPPVGFGIWRCNTCSHEWKGHSKVRQCPKCHSPDLKQTPFEQPEKTAATSKSDDASIPPMTLIALKDIERSPTNPRKNFDQAKLEDMADSMRKVGLLEPVLVRRIGSGEYELLGGERRWRAAKMARLEKIPCRVFDVTDEEALEIQARENFDREDLDPIERAITFQQLLEKGGHTQDTLAKRFRVSQELISNAIRLLRLPDKWKQKIISREMSPSHARELVPWVDLPAVMEKLEQTPAETIGSLKEFRTRILGGILEECSRSMNPNSHGSDKPVFRASKVQLELLDVRTVPKRWGGGSEKRAFNVELWRKLQAEARKKAREKAPKKAKRSSPTNDDYARQREQREFARSLFNHRLWFLADRILDQLDPVQHAGQIQRLILADLLNLGYCFEALKQSGKRHVHFTEEMRMGEIVKLKTSDLESFAHAIVVAALRDRDDYRAFDGISGFGVEWLAKELRIDFEKTWEPTAGFLKLFSEDRLKALYAEVGFPPDTKPAAVLVQWPIGVVPSDLLYATEHGEIKRPKGTKKPKRAKAGAK